MPSVRERNATPLPFRSSRMQTRCESERPRRSSFQTTSTSPACNPARRVFRPARSSRPAGCNRAPLFQPRPEPLHVVAIVVDPLRTGHRGFVLLGRDRRTRTQVPDVLAEGVTAQASVRHHPLRHAGQALQEWDGLRQLMRLAWSQDEGHRASEPVGDHARLGPIAPTRAAQGFTAVPLSGRAPLSSCPGRFLVRPNAGAIEKRHPELNATVLDQRQKLLPDTQTRPADEGLGGSPPRAEISGDGPPLGSVLMPPENGRDREPQVLWRGLALGPARLDEWLKLGPLRVRQHRSSSPQKEQNARKPNQFKP